uniref:Nucleoside phosphorylase domain-containing protein n=1 Tax=Bicosoecida sp. CB-2014 TaxID=1486930 RepID=A0A7S1CNX1_9STRA|mmetsp:Transcript_60/g.213  ORF Transcript_60/g.213 Transcript_60/m.213 type:complete len:346 (+) Transcript_60:105-1142(+)
MSSGPSCGGGASPMVAATAEPATVAAGGMATGLLSDARIVVVSATDEEASHLIERLRGVDGEVGPRETTLSRRWRLVEGTVGSRRVDVLVSRIGLSHAAMAVTALMCLSEIKNDMPAAVISMGCGGAHVETMRPGDVVVSSACVPLSAKRVHADGSSTHVGIRLGMRRDGGASYECDTALVDVARRAILSTALPTWPGQPRPPSVHVGAVGSSDTFMQHGPTLRKISSMAGTVLEEMEAVSVAAVAAEYGVLHLAIKDCANNELVGDSWTGGGLKRDELGRRAALATLAVLRCPEVQLPCDVMSLGVAACSGGADARFEAENRVTASPVGDAEEGRSACVAAAAT